jgi:hypothetical protein
MQVHVEGYSDYRADERPVRFYLNGRKHEVRKIIDRWFGEMHDYFKLQTEDDSEFILRHHRSADTWAIAVYTAPEAHEAGRWQWVSR